MTYLLLSLAAIAGFLAWGSYSGRSDYVYLSAAILASLIPFALAITKRRFDMFEPINVAALTIFFGTTLRAFYVVFLPERIRASFLMMGQDFASINAHIAWVIIAIASFCLGYAIFRGRFAIEHSKLFAGLALQPSRFNALLIASLAISIAGCALYVAYFGIDLNQDLLSQSRKRTLVYVNDLRDTVYGAGWQQQLARMGLYTGFMLACAMIARIVRPTGYWLALLGALFFFGSIVSFLGSARSPVIIAAFGLLVFAHYYKRVRAWHVVGALGALLIFVTAMGIVRDTNVGTQNRVDFLDHTLGSGNGFDAIRTTAIIDRVPDQADYLYGESYVAVTVGLIPRAVWPNKPRTSLGAWVKEEVFRTQAELHGWPPGFVAEGYANFGFLGLVVMPFLTGILLRAFYETARPLLGRSFLLTAVYASVLYRMTFSLLSLNLAQAVATAIVSALPVVGIFVLSARQVSRQVPERSARATRVGSNRSGRQEGLIRTPP
jgi:oligosaccharide repeat unit polymerase